MKLFEAFRLGDLELPNRIVMAPMTRNRAEGTLQSKMAATHYAARASAGLIISEATQVSARGQGYENTPGIHNAAQAKAWKAVTDAVHAAGGRIFAQLVHNGRLSHSDYHGQVPVAPSAIKPLGFIRTPMGTKEYENPYSPTLSEIAGLVDEFGTAGRLARDAGFDGVEIHGANGFLIDQFLQSGTNARTDAYGGPVENRVRFALEITEAVMAYWPRERVGFTISPGGNHKGIRDDNPFETFSHAAGSLSGIGLGYLHVLEQPIGEMSPTELMRQYFPGVIMTSEGYTKLTGEFALRSGVADLIAFGRAFTANPDLVRKLREDEPLDLADSKTFYTGGARGYIEPSRDTAFGRDPALTRD